MSVRLLLLALLLLLLLAPPMAADAQEPAGKHASPTATKGAPGSGAAKTRTRVPAQKRPRAKRGRARERVVSEKATIARPPAARRAARRQARPSASSLTMPAEVATGASGGSSELPVPSAPGEQGAAASTDAAALSSQADEAVRREGDSEIKTVEFGGLDIEGQLKTPQMLYFLNRLRAEFNRPELPHRSFMPELQRGTREEAFR